MCPTCEGSAKSVFFTLILADFGVTLTQYLMHFFYYLVKPFLQQLFFREENWQPPRFSSFRLEMCQPKCEKKRIIYFPLILSGIRHWFPSESDRNAMLILYFVLYCSS